ncbi:MAG: serine/threonine protein kinase-related [Planctomycetota bacterium]|nr:MAG: serine/threonine protein kinase-related [Planctomycetota bacterium]
MPVTPATLRPDQPAPESFHFEIPAQRYQVKKEHARGGMGRILIAADALMGRDVAIKEILAPGAVATTQDLERFLREARITSQLEHPNIVPVHEIGRNADGSIFYTMKFVRGETMAGRLDATNADKSLTPGEALAKRLSMLDAFVDVCNAVAYAHSRGVVNRDLKPANVMLGEYGETLVLDWGLACVKGQADTNAEKLQGKTRSFGKAPITESSKLTYAGDVLGTPAYMPPEQAQGKIELVDEKSDVYSLGAMLYEIVTGCMPFLFADVNALMNAVKNDKPLPILTREREAPPELAALVESAMERDREKRLASAKQLADEVKAFRDGRALSVYTYSLEEQVRRFLRRNRGLAATLAMLFLVCVAAAVISTVFAQNSARDASAAIEQSRNAAFALEIARANAVGEKKEKEAAERALVLADGQRLAAIATQLSDTNPGLSLLLGLEAAERAPGPAANDALISALSQLFEWRRFNARTPLTCVALGGVGGRVAAGGEGGTVHLFKGDSGAQQWQILAHKGSVTGVAFCQGGASLLSWGVDASVRLWEANTGVPAQALEDLGSPVLSVTPDQPGNRALVLPEKSPPFLWNLPDGATTPLQGTKSPATSCRWSPDGRSVATASPDGFARIYDAETGNEWRKIDMSRFAVLDVAWTPDGRFLYAGALNGAIQKLEAKFGVRSGTLNLEFAVEGMRLDVHPEDGRVAATLKRAGAFEVRIFAADGSGMTRVGPFATEPVACLGWRAFAAADGADVFVRGATGKAGPTRLRGHENTIRALAVEKRGHAIVSASADGTATVWDVRGGRGIFPLLPPAQLGTVMYLHGGESALATPSIDDPLQRVDTSTGEPFKDWNPPERIPVSRYLSPSDGRLLALFDEGPILLLEPRKGMIVGRWLPEGRARRLAAWSPGGDWFLVFTPSGGEVRRASTGDLQTVVSFGSDRVTQAAISDDAGLVAFTEEGSAEVVVIRSADGSVLRRLHAHEPTVSCMEFQPKGPCLLTTGTDATVRIWNASTGVLLSSLKWPQQEIVTPRFSRDGSRVLLSGKASGVRLVEAESLNLVLTLNPEQATEAIFCTDGARFLAWTHDRAASYPLDPRAAALKAKTRELTAAERGRFGLPRAAAKPAVPSPEDPAEFRGDGEIVDPFR